MKQKWNKPDIKKLNILSGTLGGAGVNTEMVNGGDAMKVTVS